MHVRVCVCVLLHRTADRKNNTTKLVVRVSSGKPHVTLSQLNNRNILKAQALIETSVFIYSQAERLQ